jgi:C-terminal processing protease CtpA/Prc
MANSPKDIINQIIKLLDSNYIFPGVGIKMINHLVQNESKYQSLIKSNEEKFAIDATKNLREICKDKHLEIIFDKKLQSKLKNDGDYSDETKLKFRQNNFGFKKIEIFDGNIGYFKLDQFIEIKQSKKVAEATMRFISNTKAVIIDLRDNQGGTMCLIKLLSSYFFSPTPIHLNSFIWFPTSEETESWTHEKINGKRLINTPLYILTSHKTFSAAEEFAYNLQNLNRATIIGETTAGGAHPVASEILSKNLFFSIPSGRSINPITNTNWEGTGVIPNIKCKAEDALEKAKKLAITQG